MRKLYNDVCLCGFCSHQSAYVRAKNEPDDWLGHCMVNQLAVIYVHASNCSARALYLRAHL